MVRDAGLSGRRAVLRAVNRSNAGILVDALHFFRSSSSIEELAALPPEWFRFVQVCDAPAEAPPRVEGVIHTARSARSLPGYGHLPLGELLEHPPRGPYWLEVPNDVVRQANSEPPNTPAWCWRRRATSSPTAGSRR